VPEDVPDTVSCRDSASSNHSYANGKGPEMNESISLVMAVALCVVLAGTTQAKEGTDVLDGLEDATVKIALTKFDLGDAALQLSWKITNDTDRDVWVCTGVSLAGKSGIDRLSDKDGRTLLLRRQFELPKGTGWEHVHKGEYTRLHPGQENAESYSLALPVFLSSEFGYSYPHGESADRLALEIGYYDEDLPRLILHVAEVAQKLGCDLSGSSLDWTGDLAIADRFFGGWSIARIFNGDSFFRNAVESDADKLVFPHLGQVFRGEKVVRVTIDGVSLPYEGGIWPERSD